MPTISKSQFKPQMLAHLRAVEETGEPLILTDHGRPVVKIVSLVADAKLEDVQALWRQRVADGSVRYDPSEGTAPLPTDAWGDLG